MSFVNSISPRRVIGHVKVINFLLLGVERFTFTWLLYFVIATTHMVGFVRNFYDHPEVKLPFITLSLHTSLINFLIVPFPLCVNIMKEKWTSNNVKSCDKYVCHYCFLVNIDNNGGWKPLTMDGNLLWWESQTLENKS